MKGRESTILPPPLETFTLPCRIACSCMIARLQRFWVDYLCFFLFWVFFFRGLVRNFASRGGGATGTLRVGVSVRVELQRASEPRCGLSSMLPFFIFSLMLFLVVSVVIVPGLMQQSEAVVEEVVGMWRTPSLFSGVAALLLFLVCIPGGPLAPVMNAARNM